MINFITQHWHTIVAGIIGIYEVIIRIVPTAQSWSLVSTIIEALKWLSDHLDNTTK